MTLRPMLAALPAYVPGRTVPGAIKLASNETPYSPLPHVVERITAAAGEINRYPDNYATELTAVLAAKYGVDVEQVRVGCGSVSLCDRSSRKRGAPTGSFRPRAATAGMRMRWS